MCWECDHPEATKADFLDHMLDLMDTFGWAVQGVERDGIHPPWAYTVGLTRVGQPELVATGLSLRRATRLLNGQAAHLLHAPAFQPGEQFELAGGPVIQVVQVAEPTAHLETALQMFGPRIRALQLVHADDRDHWPWEPGYRGVRGGQPVLGIPVTSAAAQPGTPAPLDAQEAGGSSGGAVREKSTVRTRTSRGSGKGPVTRGPRRRSARSRARRPSRRR